MDFENTNSDVGTTNPESAPAETDSFMTAFNGGGMPDYDVVTNEGIPADNTEADTAEEEAKEAEKPAEDGGKDYAIKYKGKEETLHLTDEQLIKELQKARDYDTVRKERDDLKGASGNGQAALSIVEYFANQNDMTVDEYIEFCNGQMGDSSEMDRLTQEYGELPEAAAKELIAARREAAAKRAAEADEAKIKADLDALKAEYPDADVGDLPEDVKAAIESGMKPLEAYRMHELRELRKSKAALDAEIAALKKEKDNHFRSAGRAESKTSGAAADPFTKGFMGGG